MLSVVDNMLLVISSFRSLKEVNLPYFAVLWAANFATVPWAANFATVSWAAYFAICLVAHWVSSKSGKFADCLSMATDMRCTIASWASCSSFTAGLVSNRVNTGTGNLAQNL